MGIINLYDETIHSIEESGHTIHDIFWIGSKEIQLPIQKFFEVAKNTTYANDYGIEEIPLDLVIVFKDNTFLKRSEYDGSEWWTFCATPTRPRAMVRNFSNLVIQGTTGKRSLRDVISV